MGPLQSTVDQSTVNCRLGGSSFEKRAQFARPRRVPQLAQRLGLDLPDALARDREALADLLERMLAAVADAEPHLDDLLLARRERLEDRLGLFLQVQVDHGLGGRDDLPILDEIAQMRIFLFADRRLERDRLLRDLQHLADLAHRDVHPLGDLFGRRLAPELLHERAAGADQLVDRLDHVHRDPDRPGLVGNRARDRLADPPRRVGRELVAAAVFELVQGLHQADVALLNQIQELQAAVGVLLGNRHDEPEVRFDQLLLGLLGLPLAPDDRIERLLELLGRLRKVFGRRLQLGLQVLDLLLDVLAILFLEALLLVLRIELPFGGLDLALDRADALDGVLHLVDQAPLHRLGELDLADALRHRDQRAHRRPPGAPVLPLLPRGRAPRRLGEPLLALLEVRARLAHRVDLPLDLAGALDDPLVGDLLVVEDHQLADGALAAVELVAERDHPLGDDRRPRDRLDDRQLPALDAPRDLDLALAREQRDGAHLAQVHPHRIVGLVERAGREIQLQLLGALAGAVDRLLVAEVLLIRVDDLDAGAAER